MSEGLVQIGGAPPGGERRGPRPAWLRIQLATPAEYHRVRRLVEDLDLHTVCQEARCPNIYECWGRHGTATLMARPFNHAGPRQADLYVLSSFARQVAEVEAGLRERIEVGNLDVVRDFTDVRDIVRAYRLLAERGHPGEIYNVGTGRDDSLATLLDTLRRLARTPVEVVVDPARVRPVDQPLLLADATKLRSHTGWQPAFTAEQTLADMLAYW